MKIINLFPTTITLIILSQNANAGDLNALCQQLEGSYTTNEHCYGVFSQDSTSNTASYDELAAISIDILTSDAAELHSSIGEALKRESSKPRAKNVLRKCSSFYSEGEPELKAAKKESVGKNYKGIVDALGSYMFVPIQECLDEFNKARVPVSVVSNFTAVGHCFVAQSTQKVVGKAF